MSYAAAPKTARAASHNTFHYLPQYLRRILKVRARLRRAARLRTRRGSVLGTHAPRASACSGGKWTWSSRSGRCCTFVCRPPLCACPASGVTRAAPRAVERGVRARARVLLGLWADACVHARACRYRHTTYHKRACVRRHGAASHHRPRCVLTRLARCGLVATHRDEEPVGERRPRLRRHHLRPGRGRGVCILRSVRARTLHGATPVTRPDAAARPGHRRLCVTVLRTRFRTRCSQSRPLCLWTTSCSASCWPPRGGARRGRSHAAVARCCEPDGVCLTVSQAAVKPLPAHNGDAESQRGAARGVVRAVPLCCVSRAARR
jgi:hypothetical protein